MFIKQNYQETKEIIRQGIEEKINFSELRSRLPGWRKRLLQSLILDVMEEVGLKDIPFPGLLVRPRLARKPVPIDSNGTLCIQDLLTEKGFEGRPCQAFCHVGTQKITLTIKPVQVGKLLARTE